LDNGLRPDIHHARGRKLEREEQVEGFQRLGGRYQAPRRGETYNRHAAWANGGKARLQLLRRKTCAADGGLRPNRILSGRLTYNEELVEEPSRQLVGVVTTEGS